MGPEQSCILRVIHKLTSWKVDVVFAILNLICECVSAALEQVVGDGRLYLWAGFACALMAVGFAVGELLWMKQNKIHIGLLDFMGFAAAVLQILSFCMQIGFAYRHTPFPIKFSLFSIMFVLISACHKMFWKSGTHKFILHCKESCHYLPVTVKEKHSRKTLLECPFCDTFCDTDTPPHRRYEPKYLRIPLEDFPPEVREWIQHAPLNVIEWLMAFVEYPPPVQYQPPITINCCFHVCAASEQVARDRHLYLWAGFKVEERIQHAPPPKVGEWPMALVEYPPPVPVRIGEASEQVAGDRRLYIWVGFACALVNKIHISLPDFFIGFAAAVLRIFSCILGFVYRHTPFSIKFSLFSISISIMFGLISACHKIPVRVGAASEQVAGDRRLYLWAGFACAFVVVGFAVGELLMDFMGFAAAVLRILSCILGFVYRHTPFPIKFSLFSISISIMFVLISACHKMFLKSGTHKFIMYCKESSHYLPLTVSKEKHSRKTFLECPFCDTETPHQRYEYSLTIPRIPLEDAPPEVEEWIQYAPPKVGEWILSQGRSTRS